VTRFDSPVPRNMDSMSMAFEANVSRETLDGMYPTSGIQVVNGVPLAEFLYDLYSST